MNEKEDIQIILNYPDKQQTIYLKGRITHLQHDMSKFGNRFQLWIEDVDKTDEYVKVTKTK